MNSIYVTTNMKRIPFLPLLFAVLSLSWFSCENETPAPLPEEGYDRPSVFIVLPPNGPGDNGYLDKVMSAASQYAISNPGEVGLLVTEDSILANGVYTNLEEMLVEESVEDTVLSIFVGSEYRDILYNAARPLPNHQVLLIEDDGIGAPDWLHTCDIEMYGASWLAGAMLAQQKASIIAAMPGERSLDRSIEGFKNGYGSVKGREVDSVYYLADNHKGFTMQYKAQKICNSIVKKTEGVYHTFFPLAGAANMGVYNALLEYGSVQAVGMDKDYSPLSDCIPFSINVGIDALILDCLAQWNATRELPKKRVEGLNSEYVEFVFNETWNSSTIFYGWENESQEWNEDNWNKVLTVEFWKQRYALFVDQAIKEEKAYEKH